MIQFKKAERKKAKLRLALAGPAGSGKTYGALQIAFGLGGRVAMIDTENHSGELYSHLGNYDVAVIDPPFIPEKYTEAIREAERLGYGIIIVDSLTHAWAGQGGLLDIHGNIADRGGNSWTAWRQVTPRHNELVEAMLQSKCHVIATMRSKMGYVQTVENEKTIIKKVGMSPIQRDGMEYEFTVFIDIDINHVAMATKDRTSIFDGQVFKIDPKVSKKLLVWLEAGAQPEPQVPVQPQTSTDWEEIPFANELLPEPSSREPKKQRPQSDQGATQAQIGKIFATANDAEVYEDKLKALCKNEFGKPNLELTKAEASKLIDILLDMAKNRKQAPACAAGVAASRPNSPPPAGGENGNSKRRLF